LGEAGGLKGFFFRVHLIWSDASRTNAQPILSGRMRHAPTRSPFYLVESVTRQRAVHFTWSKASRANAQPILPDRKRHAPTRSPFYPLKFFSQQTKSSIITNFHYLRPSEYRL
jgi:hypothetical protein